MVYCPKCGHENEGNASFCQNCGTRIKPKENNNRISKLINWKAIIIGAVVYFVLLVLIDVLIFPFISGGTVDMTSASGTIIYFLVMTTTGIITGFYSKKEYLSGIINSLIVAVFYSIFWGFSGGLYNFAEGLIFLGVSALIGGFIGVLIYRKYNNYNLTD